MESLNAPVFRADDKAGEALWSTLWEGQALPRAIEPRSPRVGRYIERRFHALFTDTFRDFRPAGKRLLEVGCASSSWLPYFATEFGFKVSGIDYSESGCMQSQRILRREHVDGEITCCDLFHPPASFHGEFDTVISFGVIEHFLDTAGVLKALGDFLSPDGILITVIPNMSGSLGWACKWIDRPTYEIHVPLNRQQFAEAHRNAGLAATSVEYFGLINYGVLSMTAATESGTNAAWKQWVRKGLRNATSLVWYAEERSRLTAPESHLFSPYIAAVAHRA